MPYQNITELPSIFKQNTNFLTVKVRFCDMVGFNILMMTFSTEFETEGLVV